MPVTREGETFAIALGLLMGGKKPVVCIQNTGFFESGDSIRGIWIDLKLPILALVGYRGWEGGGPSADSAATFLEPVIKAWGIPYEIVQTDDEVAEVVPRMYAKSQETPDRVARADRRGVRGMIEGTRRSKCSPRTGRTRWSSRRCLTARTWPAISEPPGSGPAARGCMGKASSLGLGVALARPDVRVMVLDGDGSLLMNLGSLVTVAAQAPKNLMHVRARRRAPTTPAAASRRPARI